MIQRGLMDAGPKLSTFYNVFETMFESVRLTTFSNWESKYLTKEEASSNGRVECRTGGKPKLQCVFCGTFVTLDLRNENMKVLLQKSHSPYCPISCSHPTGNVPLSTDNLDEAEVYEFLEKYLKERKDNNHICMGYKPGYGESESEPGFEKPYRRQETFKNWPLDFFPERLIEGGFIYTGLSDFVLCPKCGIGFYNWSPEDNPMKEHKTHISGSTCPFITLEDEDEESFKEINFRALTDSEEELLLKHPIGKLMREVLPNADVKIKETLASFLTKYGVMPITVGQAVAFMQRKKDQYDAEFRKIMKFGNRRTSFVRAEDISDHFIEVSEFLKSKHFEQAPKINLNRNYSGIISGNCIGGNINSKFASENIEIDPTENFLNSARQELILTLNYTAYDSEADLDSTYESSSNNISEVINDVKVAETTISQAFKSETLASNAEEYNYEASSTMVESCIEPEPGYFDSMLSSTSPYSEEGNIDLDLNLESFNLSSLDMQNKYFQDFNNYTELFNAVEGNEDHITIDQEFSQLKLGDD